VTTKQPALVRKQNSGLSKSLARIIHAATNLFAERGFDATSTNAIAVEARVPSGLIFYHFHTKEALLDEIFKAPGFPEELDHIIDDVADKTPMVALNIAAVQAFRWLDDNKQLVRLFFKEMTSYRPVASRLHTSRRRNNRRVAEYLDAAIDRREMAPVNTKVLAQLFVSSLLLTATFDRKMNVHAFARALSETIARAGDRLVPPSP
jgi:AcrR family transcriptional regulator